MWCKGGKEKMFFFNTLIFFYRFLLSKVYQDQENLLDAKKCLLFALKLSDTSPIVSVSTLPRFV